MSSIWQMVPELEHLAGKVTIVAFGGKMKTGKSTATDILTSIDSDFEKRSFATILKDEYAKRSGINREHLDDVALKENYRTGTQQASAEFLALDPFYFARRLFVGCSPGDKIGIDDLRYLHELWLIHALGGTPVKMYADANVRKARGWKPNIIADTHLSETDVGDLSHETFHSLKGTQIINHGSKDQLGERILDIRNTLLTKKFGLSKI
jgi:phosphomevalonate kinase